MTHPTCEQFVTSLAEDSTKTKLYTVFIIVTSDIHFTNILKWNQGQKIRGCISECR
jgi:hypothetical protein